MPKRLIIIDWESALYANNEFLFPAATQKLLKRIHKQADTKLVILTNSKNFLITEKLTELLKNKNFISNITIYDKADLAKKKLTPMNLAQQICQKETISLANVALVSHQITLNKVKTAEFWPILVLNGTKSHTPVSANYLNCLPGIFNLDPAAKNELYGFLVEKKREQIRTLYDQFVADLSYQRGIKWLSDYQTNPTGPVYHRARVALITAWNLYTMIGKNVGVLYSQLALVTLYERGRRTKEWLQTITKLAEFYLSMSETERNNLGGKQAFYALFRRSVNHANVSKEVKELLTKAVLFAELALKAPAVKYSTAELTGTSFYAVASTSFVASDSTASCKTSNKLETNSDSSPAHKVKSPMARSTSFSSS